MKTNILLATLITVTILGCASSAPIQSADMVANADPYEVGVVGASFSTFTGFNKKLGTFILSFAPRTNQVIIDTKNQGNETHIYLDRANRDALIVAMTSYFKEFENRTLKEKGKTLNEYGKIIGFMEWGLLTMNARGNPEIRLGYEFKEGSPFFTLTFPETDNILYNKGSAVKNSGYFQMFFTRSQLEEFGEMLLQDYLVSTLEEQDISRASSDPDVY
ncbi:MAG TPA: hypothetical protein VJ861_09575 [Treponemataceae bacterium]|nr:hypothetical protein [Treponemataceae bacterium]